MFTVIACNKIVSEYRKTSYDTDTFVQISRRMDLVAVARHLIGIHVDATATALCIDVEAAAARNTVMRPAGGSIGWSNLVSCDLQDVMTIFTLQCTPHLLFFFT